MKGQHGLPAEVRAALQAAAREAALFAPHVPAEYGALGVSADLPLAQFQAEVRPFRIYDGPSEVHRMSLARRALRKAAG